MNKISMFMFAMILFLPLIYATDIGYIGSNITIVSNHPLAQNGYFDSVTAYINIFYPNGTQSILNTQILESSEQGVFYYNYTPNVTGVYYTYTQFYNGSEDIGIGSSTFYVSAEDNMYLAVIVGLIALIIYFIYLGKDLMSKPISEETNISVYKWLNTQTVGLFVYMLASWLVLSLFFVLSLVTVSSSLGNFFDTLFTIFLWVIPLTNVGYWIFYITFKVMSSMRKAIRMRK